MRGGRIRKKEKKRGDEEKERGKERGEREEERGGKRRRIDEKAREKRKRRERRKERKEKKGKRKVDTQVGRYFDRKDKYRGNSILEGILPPLRPPLQWLHHTNEQQLKPVGCVHVHKHSCKCVCTKCEEGCVHCIHTSQNTLCT